MAFNVEYFTVDAGIASSRYVTLAGAPDASSNVSFDIIGGTAQMYGDTTMGAPALGNDFRVDSSRVKWDYTSSPLYSLVAVGHKLRVIYDRV